MSDGALSVISCVLPSCLTAWCGIAPCTVMYLSHLFCVACVSDPSFILPHCYVTSYEYVLIYETEMRLRVVMVRCSLFLDSGYDSDALTQKVRKCPLFTQETNCCD